MIRKRVTGKGAPSFWSRRIHKQGSHFLPAQEREQQKLKLERKRVIREKRERSSAVRKAPPNLEEKKNKKN